MTTSLFYNHYISTTDNYLTEQRNGNQMDGNKTAIIYLFVFPIDINTFLYNY